MIAEESTVPITTARPPFEMWATIKKSSKYYRQGLADQTDPKSKPVPFKIHGVVMEEFDSYDFKGGVGGAYRREDLQLYVRLGNRLKKI